MINATTLNCYALLIRDELARCDGARKILIMRTEWWPCVKKDPMRAKKLLNRSFARWYPDEQKEDWEDVETVYFPIHWPVGSGPESFRQGHWSCGYFDFPSRRFGQYDSIFDATRAVTVRETCSMVLVQHPQGEGHWRFESHENTYNAQTNSFDCGVWTGTCILYLALGVKPDCKEGLKEKDMKSLRQKMLVSINRRRILR